MAAKKILFIEGGDDTANGDLRQGFSKLFEKVLSGSLPRIILGGGKSQTIQKFLKNQQQADCILLLMDLDDEESTKKKDLAAHNLTACEDKVFYMVQEMESWFISQPDVLDGFFGIDSKKKKISQKIPKKPANSIRNPKEVLRDATRDSQKRAYHPIKHGVELLKRLDAQILENEFPDFGALVKILR